MRLPIGPIALAIGAAWTASAIAQAPALLKVASTSSLTGVADSAQEKAGQEALKRFIKEETGLATDIGACEPWAAIADRLAKNEIHFGVFQGYEFAWALAKHPELKPLAVGVNGPRNPVACLLTRKDHPAAALADLKGQSLVVPRTIQPCAPLFVDRAVERLGQKTDAFFKEVKAVDDIEGALDSVIDGPFNATVIDEAALEAYKRRKPGRFKQLKEIARSEPFPPIVIAYKHAALDGQTLDRFRGSLVNAAKKEKGEMLLTLSRLSGFETPAADLPALLTRTRKDYPER
jgi:ABC-type phosphate/phosphonate transport system substrate-binding protein